MRALLAVVVSLCILLVGFVAWRLRSNEPAASVSPASTVVPASSGDDSSAATAVYAHNLLLRRGPDFRVYVPWLRGNMVRTHTAVNPTFDDPESFVLEIKTGVVRANIGDIGKFLNAGGLRNSPLTNVTLVADHDQIKLQGTLHKFLSIPIELLGDVAAASNNRVQVHVTKLSVLKIPLKGLLGEFHINVSDLFHPSGVPGIEVSGNDIFLDTVKLLPPPHLRGQLTKVRVVSPDVEAVYGNAEEALTRVEEWRNFLRLDKGTIDFGKLTMHHVDLMMVDLSNDAWFDLDLNNYQKQLVNGYTRMTPEAGLLIFMPDLDNIPKTRAEQNISMEWLKHRNLPPPPDITSK